MACTSRNMPLLCPKRWAGRCSQYSNWLWAGGSGDWIPVGARFSAPVQTSPGAYPASCTMGTGSFPGVKSSQGVMLTPHPLLVQWSRKGTAIPLLHLGAVQPVRSLSACTRVHFTFFFMSEDTCEVCSFELGVAARYTDQAKLQLSLYSWNKHRNE
jgi:hypothetical protein